MTLGGSCKMAADVEIALRGPQAYDLARDAIAQMESHQIWPTPLNFELWLHYAGDPEGPLAQEMHRILAAGETITEALSETLAASYLPKAKLNQEIRDAGDQLTRELEAVSKAIRVARKSSDAYGETLADASRDLSAPQELPAIKKLVDNLSSATRKVQRENKALEKRLQESTTEVGRLREHLEQVRRDATTDSLTNLANRKAFDDELDRARSEAEKTGEPLTLAVVDIDHFKRFNDTWGHQTGDQVLRYVASVIGRMCAPPRFAARYGGEEFGMIFPNETADTVMAVLEEVRLEVSSRTLMRRSTNEDLGAVTISAGVASVHGEETTHSLVERADAALYASKRTGRNKITNAELDIGMRAA
jgi:diguanylate cyclase